MNAKSVWQKLSFQIPKSPYDVTFSIITTLNLTDLDRKLSDYEKFQSMEVVAISLTIHQTDQPSLYRLFTNQLAIPVCNGWLDEFADLMDGAENIFTFNQTVQYGCLRKYFPSEQRMIYWQFITFDLFTIIKAATKQWCSLQSLLAENGLAGSFHSNQLGVTQAARDQNWEQMVCQSFDHLDAICALHTLVKRRVEVNYLESVWKEVEGEGRKEKKAQVKSLSLLQHLHSLSG